VASDAAAAFLQDYEAGYPALCAQAALLETFIRERLSDRNYDVHLVTARAKTLESVTTKLLFKNYAEPAKAVTDLIGVRIITYYGEQVDRIAERLRDAMTVDKTNSWDKRQDLIDGQRFGYRSVHVVGKLNIANSSKPAWSALKGRVFEVQIRSVLDHAWAEVEHEIVYKAGSQFPVEYKRRFSAVAGAFEILEHEILRLKEDADALVDRHVVTYAAGRERSALLDGARLTALLEVRQPHGPGWRQKERLGLRPDVSVRRCVKALERAGIVSSATLEAALKTTVFKSALENYASLAGVTTSEASHFAVVALLVGRKDGKILADYLPEIADSQAISGALA
jgi:ppGpp synthetase/RelA/SpoT-type nucleotidyltranferase